MDLVLPDSSWSQVPSPAACEWVLGVSGSTSCFQRLDGSLLSWFMPRAFIRGHFRLDIVLSSLGWLQLCGRLWALWLLFCHEGDGGCPGCLHEALQVQ